MAKGYILVHVTVPDMKAYQASGYMGMAQAAVAAHGGRFMVRGGNPEALEGAAPTDRIVILEFPSRAAAKRFSESDDYEPARTLRNQFSAASMILLEEYEPS